MYKIILTAILIFRKSALSETSVCNANAAYKTKPFIFGNKMMLNGSITNWDKNVTDVFSPITDVDTGDRAKIGVVAVMDSASVEEVIKVAKAAWNNGLGEWPQMTPEQRIASVSKLAELLILVIKYISSHSVSKPVSCLAKGRNN